MDFVERAMVDAPHHGNRITKKASLWEAFFFTAYLQISSMLIFSF